MAATIDRLEFRIKKAALAVPYCGATAKTLKWPKGVLSGAISPDFGDAGYETETRNPSNLPTSVSGSNTFTTIDGTFTETWSMSAGALQADGTVAMSVSYSISGPYPVSINIEQLTPGATSGTIYRYQAVDGGFYAEWGYTGPHGDISGSGTVGYGTVFAPGYPYSGDPFSLGSHNVTQARIANLVLSQSAAADYVNAVGGESCEMTRPSGTSGAFTAQRGETRAFGSGATPFSAVDIYFHFETDDGTGWADIGNETMVTVYADANGNFVTPWTYIWGTPEFRYRLKGGNDVDFTSRAMGPPGP